MKRRILEVFRTYCDCYLEFLNNFINGGTFCEFYELDSDEWIYLLKAVKMLRENEGRFTELDYYYHIATNGTFSEKTAVF